MIQFRMQQIKVDQFALLAEKMPESHLKLETNIGLSADKAKRTLCVKLKNNLLSEENLILTLAISCFFEFSKDSWESMRQNEKYVITKSTISHLAMHTFGTARGILFSKTEGTPFCSFILPPTNVEEMIQGDIIV